MGEALEESDMLRAIARYHRALQVQLKIYGKQSQWTLRTYTKLREIYRRLSDAGTFGEELVEADGSLDIHE